MNDFLYTNAPDAITESWEWLLNAHISIRGVEQRELLRQAPRVTLRYRYTLESPAALQQWKFSLTRDTEDEWEIPAWAWSRTLSAAATAGSSSVSHYDTARQFRHTEQYNSGDARFLLVDIASGVYETLAFSSGSSTSTSFTTNLANNYPAGSLMVPLEPCLLENNQGITMAPNNAGEVTLVAQSQRYSLLGGQPVFVLASYNGLLVLDKRPLAEGAREVFSKNVERVGFVGYSETYSQQVYANVGSTKAYRLDLAANEQAFWVAFLQGVSGPLELFYTPTFRHDMTVTTQPIVGGDTFTITDDNTADVWAATFSHGHLAIETADGDTQYKEIASATDNLDGTYDVTLTTGLTATADGSTIEKVSFLELVRVAGPVVINYSHKDAIIQMPFKTLQT